MSSYPPPTVYANYRGDVTGAVGQIVGPNTIGEHLRLVSVAYDPETDRSRAGFSYVLTDAS